MVSSVRASAFGSHQERKVRVRKESTESGSACKSGPGPVRVRSGSGWVGSQCGCVGSGTYLERSGPEGLEWVRIGLSAAVQGPRGARRLGIDLEQTSRREEPWRPMARRCEALSTYVPFFLGFKIEIGAHMVADWPMALCSSITFPHVMHSHSKLSSTRVRLSIPKCPRPRDAHPTFPGWSAHGPIPRVLLVASSCTAASFGGDRSQLIGPSGLRRAKAENRRTPLLNGRAQLVSLPSAAKPQLCGHVRPGGESGDAAVLQRASAGGARAARGARSEAPSRAAKPRGRASRPQPAQAVEAAPEEPLAGARPVRAASSRAGSLGAAQAASERHVWRVHTVSRATASLPGAAAGIGGGVQRSRPEQRARAAHRRRCAADASGSRRGAEVQRRGRGHAVLESVRDVLVAEPPAHPRGRCQPGARRARRDVALGPDGHPVGQDCECRPLAVSDSSACADQDGTGKGQKGNRGDLEPETGDVSEKASGHLPSSTTPVG
eukprot:scaffold570_cov234-Pinguiococcus_pyrenoidosus.AAC.7